MSEKNDDDPKPTLEVPKQRGRAVVIGPKQRRQPVDTSLIPALIGETIRIGFRGDAVTVGDINSHLDRLERRAPGLMISASDAIRSLIRRGEQGFCEDERREQSNPDEDK
jgi:hypothetical protein